MSETPAESEPLPATAEADGTSWWPWAALLLAGLIGFGLFARRRFRAPVVYEVEELALPPKPVADELVEEAAVVPVAPVETEVPSETLAPMAAPPITTPPVIIAEPRLALTFTPAGATTGDARASVEFALSVMNEGTAPARRVRMEARLFAMGNDHEAALAAFFAAPLERPIPIASAVAPGIHAAMRSQVAIPLADVRPIAVNNRQLFVPMVAFKVLYEHDGGDAGIRTSQTTASYVVGREAKPPAAKMAPFRLDQGPKQYREVGHRVHRA